MFNRKKIHLSLPDQRDTVIRKRWIRTFTRVRKNCDKRLINDKPSHHDTSHQQHPLSIKRRTHHETKLQPFPCVFSLSPNRKHVRTTIKLSDSESSSE